MKKIVSVIFFTLVISSFFAFHKLHSGGEAGATGSPGEGNCTGCHGGGLGVTTVSITSTPAFTNNSFDPLTAHSITITVSNPSLAAFGFDCEILNAGNASTGTMQISGAGVQLATAFNGRQNATHTSAKPGVGTASWTFDWISPASGNATFYVAGNAVNSNGGTTGDRVGTAVLALNNINTSLSERSLNPVHGVSIYPNPANDVTSISYFLSTQQNLTVELLDISGKLIRTLLEGKQEAGPHSNIVDLKGVSKGIYFLKISADGEKLSQKLISVQ